MFTSVIYEIVDNNGNLILERQRYIELVKDYTRLGLHAIGVISNILNCD